ncbi:MAG TPA: PDZ domain-containing protein [Acidimicrobiales bacterium]|nr:PDZ domain-containing protein [Acidimicrobiales bacterium]
MTTSETTLPPPPVAPTRRRRRWPVVLGVVLAVLAAAVVWASVTESSYYELVPGDAQPVAPLITLPKGTGITPAGKLLLTDVGVTTLKWIDIPSAWFDSNATLVRTTDLTDNLPVEEFDAQGNVDMAESELTAQAVALRQLGYEVPETDAGATVYVLDPGSPAYRLLRVGDVVTAIDQVPTPNPDALVSVLDTHRPGETVTLSVGSIANPTVTHAVALKLASITDNGRVKPFIGIGDPHETYFIPPMGTQPSYALPFHVDINSDDIGGPSAGLAWTLGIIDALSGGQLTGGKVVAATGTIHPDGTVGDVGGVAQKTVAVERAGAALFLVPPQELAVARSKATPGLTVMAVSSVAEALADLEKVVGGKLGTAAAGPPPGPGGHSTPYNWQESPWT